MKSLKSIVCAALAAVLLAGSLFPAAIAAEENTPKEEVVYVNLNGDGSTKDVTVVNAFTLEEDGTVTDYGNYETVRSMTTTDPLTRTGDRITVPTTAGRLYYEGTLASAELPWSIRLRYTLNGVDCSADELAGQTGHLKIHLDISRNNACTEPFFDAFALQIALTLDTEKCENILAEGATQASVGSDRQLSYIVLPGKGAEITVDADVTDFEMDSITLNGVRLNLNLSLEDSGLEEQLAELTDAVDSLNDGTSRVSEGASTLSDALNTLNGNTGKLTGGVAQLSSGAYQLADGLAALNGKSGELTDGAYSAFAGLCEVCGDLLNEQLTANGLSSMTLTPENYADVLDGLLAQMDADAVYAQAYAQALAQVTAAVEAQADTLYAAYIQQNADAILDAAIQAQADDLYTQAAAQIAAQQLAASGMEEAQISAYLQTAEGQALIEQIKQSLTPEQQAQILAQAKASLTTEQRQQILAAALAQLTEEQKAAIRTACIEQQMAGDDVTAQLKAAVESVSAAAAQVAALKGRLQQYALFYQGIREYTSAVGSAAVGAAGLQDGLNTFSASANALSDGVGQLTDAAGQLADGAGELNEGAAAFAQKTETLSDDAQEQVDALLKDATGSDVETGSFVSDKNTNVTSVQFVMKTDSIRKAAAEAAAAEEAQPMTFWQKLLSLFGWNR